MIDEYHIIAEAPKIWALKGRVSISEIRVGQVANHRGNLGSHPMLLRRSDVRKAFEDEPFEEGSVEIKTVALLHAELV